MGRDCVRCFSNLNFVFRTLKYSQSLFDCRKTQHTLLTKTTTKICVKLNCIEKLDPKKNFSSNLNELIEFLSANLCCSLYYFENYLSFQEFLSSSWRFSVLCKFIFYFFIKLIIGGKLEKLREKYVKF